MENGKLDNQLDLALSLREAERSETLDLDVGYNSDQRSWEVIVKYNGDIERIANEIRAVSTVLLNGFAILQVPEDNINRLSEYNEIEFIEKPKRIFFEVSDAKQASCISRVQVPPIGLTGKGVTVAIIDSGIDYTHPDFRNEDGTTRIKYLWDQSIRGGEQEQMFGGIVYDSQTINRALEASNPTERYEIVPSTDSSGHGTAVAGILCGNGRASQGRYRGTAYESDIIAVKLGVSSSNSFPRTTQLMAGVDFCIREALRTNIPMAINISFGNNYGGHEGNSLLENYLDEMANTGRVCIVAATGNEGAAGHHAQGRLREQSATVDFAVAEGERALNLQIWKEYQDEIDIILYAPSGWNTGIIRHGNSTSDRESLISKYNTGSTRIFIFYGEPQPYNASQEIYIEFIPESGDYIQSGIWRVELIPRRIADGRYSMWLPTGEVINDRTRFLRPSETTTLTIPSTAERVISVGAYNSDTDAQAFFSGSGFTRNNRIKPDIAAPGVDIITTTQGGYSVRTGTSFAAPFVTGSAALLMEWGIVRGNDRYLYGEKIKAYLIKGARRLPGFTEWPNPQLGWGVLCLRDSLPV